MSRPEEPPRIRKGNKSDNLTRESVQSRKRTLVEWRGGKCVSCGFEPQDDFDLAALDFHHVHHEDKLFAIGSGSLGRTWTQILDEVEKCVLLCANCDRRHHAMHGRAERAPGARGGRPRGTGRWQADDDEVLAVFTPLVMNGGSVWARCKEIAEQNGMRAHTVYQRVRRTFGRNGVPFTGAEVEGASEALSARDEGAA